MSRPRVLAFALAMALCLVAGSTPRIVGDGGEYLAMTLNLASFHRPALATPDIPWIQQTVAQIDSSLDNWDPKESSVAGRDGRRDFLHFWVYSLLAVPPFWLTQVLHVTPIAAFTFVNLCLLGAGVWLAVPRIGTAATLLIFGGPIVWWIDKPHTEAFTFSLLAIAVLLMRERPWWAMAAAGLAATQNPPIAVLVVLIAAGSAIARRDLARDRRFLIGLAAGVGLAALQPGYTYWRHGTPTLLLRANPNHLPSLPELLAVPFDPAIGLFSNFPFLVVAAVGAAVLVLRRRPKELFGADRLVAKIAGVAFLISFAQATNIHHGATPGMSRYGLWLIPLTIPIFNRARALGAAGWRRFLWTIATASAAVCAFAFHPGVPQYGREPSLLARLLWTHRPAWNNPLPEIFAEIQFRLEDRRVPIATPGCEKVLVMGRGDGGAFPVPCFPELVPDECSAAGRLCYANRVGSHYQFARAPGSKWQLEGFVFQPSWAWPAEAEPHVRDLLTQSEWWKLKPKTTGEDVMRQINGAHVVELEGARRHVFVIRDTIAGARLILRPPWKMTGVLSDALTGQSIGLVHYDGEPFQKWELSLPANAKLLMLSLWPS